MQGATSIEAFAEVSRVHSVFRVDLAEHLNNVGLTTQDTLHRGALNVWGNSLPAATLGPGTLTVGGIPFAGPAGTGSEPDNVRAEGQYVELPEVPAEWLHFLATSERRCEEVVHVHYASGAVDFEWFRVSDFWPARPHFGEFPAATSEAMHYPHHQQENLGGQVWKVRVPVPRQEPVRGLRLPDNPALHVFALSVEGVA